MKVPEQLMKLGERWGLLTRRRRELVKQEKNCGNNNKQWLVGVHSHFVREYRSTVAVPVMTPSEVYAISRSVYHVLLRGGLRTHYYCIFFELSKSGNSKPQITIRATPMQIMSGFTRPLNLKFTLQARTMRIVFKKAPISKI